MSQESDSVDHEKVFRAAPPPRFYRVSDLIKATGLSRQTIHNYTMFGLIHPVQRTEGGHRIYDEEAFKRLQRVMMLRLHRPMTEVREAIIEEFGPGPEASGKQGNK